MGAFTPTFATKTDVASSSSSTINSSKVRKVAGEMIGGHRIVLLSNDEIFKAGVSTTLIPETIFGMTLEAGVLGELVTVQTSGEIVEPSWNWLTEDPIYLADDGLMTQTVPLDGLMFLIGVPSSPTSIILNLGFPIIL